MSRKHLHPRFFPAVCSLAAVLLLALAACGDSGDAGETPTTPPSSGQAAATTSAG